jgi:hypothetical protein
VLKEGNCMAVVVGDGLTYVTRGAGAEVPLDDEPDGEGSPESTDDEERRYDGSLMLGCELLTEVAGVDPWPSELDSPEW